MGMARYYVMNESYFSKNEAPWPYKGWVKKACQQIWREGMLEAGFDLSQKIHAIRNKQTGDLIFWQEDELGHGGFIFCDN
jgi:hypothetical protein